MKELAKQCAPIAEAIAKNCKVAPQLVLAPLMWGVEDLLKKQSDALERLTAERDAYQTAYGKSDEICDGLLIENAALKEQMTADRKQFLDMRDERDALAQNAERVRVYKQRYFGAIAECAALRADAELKYTAWQSPHNDDLWLEHPADCEIIDNFHPPVHVGFEYELTAGSYTTQRYRVVKIADDESDDVLVELIAGEKK